MKKVPIIIGPTSSGKTSLALNLCKKSENMSVMSADSRQVYKNMDIGTGKQPLGSKHKIVKSNKKWGFDGVDIWGYDLTTPDKDFTAVDFADFALPKIRELHDNKKATLITGGTGFYIDILTGKTRPSKVIPDKKYRKKLEKMDLQELSKKLMSLNKDTYKKTDLHNKIRIIRAIERESLEKKRTTPLPYLKNVKFVYFGLNGPREYLYERVDKWLDNIWKKGLLDEIDELKSLGFGSSPKLNGLVYRSAISYLESKQSEEDAIQEAKYDLHAYIRRQFTWFRRYKEITWFDITKDSPEKIADKVLETLF